MSNGIIHGRISGAQVLIPALALLMLLGTGCSEKETTFTQEAAPGQEQATASQLADSQALPAAGLPGSTTEPVVSRVPIESTASDQQADTRPAAADGGMIYNSYCLACHSMGIAGAPKLGDEAAWKPRIKKGTDALFSSVKNGLNAMPPNGACAKCSDEQLHMAIEYILAAAKPPTGDQTPEATSASAVGERIFGTVCKTCHITGVAGAPKLGDKTAWKPRIAKGIDALLLSVKNGLNAMPPKGTCSNCSDEQLRLTIDYMVRQGS